MTPLRARLRNLNLTSVEFATLIAIGKRRVSAWSTGETPLPDHVDRILVLMERRQDVIEELRDIAGSSKRMDNEQENRTA